VISGQAVAGVQASPSPPAPRLFDKVRRRLRLRHDSLRSEKAYLEWIRRLRDAK